MNRFTTRDHVVICEETDALSRTLHRRPAERTMGRPREEFGTVVANGERGTLVIKTSSGRTRHVHPKDPRLRRATLVEELFQGSRFPRVWWQ